MKLSTLNAAAAAAGTAVATPLPAQIPHQTLTFDVEKVGANASSLNKQLMSLSIEFDTAIAYFGDVGQPNLFSKQLLQNVADKAGVPAVLRIGGNTQDRAQFCGTCNETMRTELNTDPNDPKQSEALFVEYNAGLFDVLTNNVPEGSPIIFGINLRDGSYEIAQNEVEAALKHLDQSLVMSYELGNEANFYAPEFREEGAWNASDYGEQVKSWISQIDNHTAPTDLAWMYGAFAGPPTFFSDGFTIDNLTQMGLPQSTPGVEYYSTHGYPYDICSNETAALVNLTNFLDHSKTVELIHTYDNETRAVKSVDGVLHMGETGTVACHGKEGVSNTLGAALWELDYALTGAAEGFDRFMFHNGQGDYYYSMWEPVGTELHPGAHIYPTYYAMLFVADLVGDLEAPTIARLLDHDTESKVHFAVYDGGCLKKLVVLNLEFFDGTCERPSASFELGDLLGKDLSVRRLTGEISAAQSGVSWSGQTIDDGGRLVGDEDVEVVRDGRVVLFASEGAVVEVGSD